MGKPAVPFWDCVDRSSGLDGCWPFTGHRDPHGYGYKQHEGRLQRAHRIAFKLAVGPIPPGASICHRCDNPPCCNPAHLFADNHVGNMADMAQKGRAKAWRGDAHPTRKLASAQILQIRSQRAGGALLKELAAEYGVSLTAISRAARGRTWGPRS